MHVPLLPPDGFLVQRIVSPNSFFCPSRMGGHTDPSDAVLGGHEHPAASARGGSPRGSRNIPPTWTGCYCQKRQTSKKKKREPVNVSTDGLLVCVTYSIPTSCTMMIKVLRGICRIRKLQNARVRTIKL